MANPNSFHSKWSPRFLSVLRVATAVLFIEHGSQKLFGIPAAQRAPHFSLLSLMGVAGVLEFFGGLLILLGLCTRPVAFILAGEMATAYLVAHAPQGFWPLLNRGELAVLYCFVFVYLAVAGGGSWSLAQLWRKGETAHDASVPNSVEK
jgi:putative oxidoreductase